MEFENLFFKEDIISFDLHVSASIGVEESVQDILNNSKNIEVINKKNRHGWTPLMYAACSTNLNVLLYLLQKGALTDLKNNFGQTALILASQCGNTDAVILLIEYKANINVKDHKGCSAISYACNYGHKSVYHYLIEKDGYSLSSDAGKVVKDTMPFLNNKSNYVAKSFAVEQHNLIGSPVANSSKSLSSLLKELQLFKYYPVFESHSIDINTFWTLSDEDLKEMGINLLGPRKKICLAISKHQLPNCNSEENELLSKLSLENKMLSQQVEKMRIELSRESELKKMAEQNLSDGILTLKRFTDNVQRSMHFTFTLVESLRQCQTELKKLLIYHPAMNQEREMISPLLEQNEKLIHEIHNQILHFLQHTDIRQ